MNRLIRGKDLGGPGSDAGSEDDGEDETAEPAPAGDSGLAEYEEDDEITTVTVDAVDVTRDGLLRIGSGEESGDEGEALNARQGGTKAEGTEAKGSNATQSKKKKKKAENGDAKTKKKRKKFRYESKAERALTRSKERAKKHDRAKLRRKT